MDAEFLSLLCSPVTHEPLELASEPGQPGESRELLIGTESGARYPLRDGIPVFLDESSLLGDNKKYQGMYDRLAPWYDLGIRLYARLKSGGEESRRMEYLRELEIRDGSRILEVSVGTGGNLRFLPRNARYFGLDISWGMLRQCRRNLQRWGREASLVYGAAEELPFKDGVFDAVLHMGGINFFNDRAQALREMVRVARPGMKIVIADEYEKIAKTYEHLPFMKYFFKERRQAIGPPVDLLPPGMLETQVRELWGGDLYCLTFRKPFSAA
jgi:ubiquinone/menaquinone biosynthesis C-methylase UbiE/uncharacterized protein YbaR (Trm112 family)